MNDKLKLVSLLASMLVWLNQNALAAEQNILSSASTMSANVVAIEPVNKQDSYLMAKYEYHFNQRDVEKITAAAASGDYNAQHQLGHIYRDGRGVTKSDIVALMWYMISVKNGSPDAKADEQLTRSYMAFDQINQARRMAALWHDKTGR